MPSVTIDELLGVFEEDTPHVDGDFGSGSLAVRQDTLAASVDTDGDYGFLKADSIGALYVNVANAIAIASDHDEDTPHVTGDTGSFMLAVANHTQGALHSTDGDYAALQVDSAGRLRTITDIDFVGDLTADDSPDDENPLKVGTRAISGVLAAISAGDDKANMISDLRRRLYVNTSPNIAAQNSSYTPGAVEVALAPSPLLGRLKMLIQNTSATDVFVGPTGVAVSGASKGIKIPKRASMPLDIGPDVAFFVIRTGAGAAGDVTVMEVA